VKDEGECRNQFAVFAQVLLHQVVVLGVDSPCQVLQPLVKQRLCLFDLKPEIRYLVRRVLFGTRTADVVGKAQHDIHDGVGSVGIWRLINDVNNRRLVRVDHELQPLNETVIAMVVLCLCQVVLQFVWLYATENGGAKVLDEDVTPPYAVNPVRAGAIPRGQIALAFPLAPRALKARQQPGQLVVLHQNAAWIGLKHFTE